MNPALQLNCSWMTGLMGSKTVKCSHSGTLLPQFQEEHSLSLLLLPGALCAGLELVLSYNCGCPLQRRNTTEGKQESLELGQGHWNNFLFKKITVPLC